MLKQASLSAFIGLGFVTASVAQTAPPEQESIRTANNIKHIGLAATDGDTATTSGLTKAGPGALQTQPAEPAALHTILPAIQRARDPIVAPADEGATQGGARPVVGDVNGDGEADTSIHRLYGDADGPSAAAEKPKPKSKSKNRRVELKLVR